MAASLWKMNKWRSLKTCLTAQWVTASSVEYLACSARPFSATCVVRTKNSDVCRQQQAEASASPVQRAPVEPLSPVEVAIQQEDHFGVKELVSLRDLFNSRVHLGHNSGLRHESMTPYIFGERQGIDIINLEQTLPLLHHALNVCAHIVYRGGMVLFVSRNMQVLPWVERMAKEVGEYSHCRPWKQGIFTNAASLFGTLPIYPELCVFFNTQDTVFQTHRGIIEASKLLVPTIGIVDTNCDCTHLTYQIPGNDDTPVSQHLFINLFKSVVLKAKQKRKEDGLDAENVLS